MARNEFGVDLDLLYKPFPRECWKTRKGGGNRNFSYIPTHLIIRRLNEATNNNWTGVVIPGTEQRIQQGSDTLLKLRYSLTIPGCGTREGEGVQVIRDNGGEDLEKGALADALKKAASMFGLNLDMYGADLEGFGAIEEEPRISEAEAKTARNRFINTAIKRGVKIASQAEADNFFQQTCHGVAFPKAGDLWSSVDDIYAKAYENLDKAFPAKTEEVGQ